MSGIPRSISAHTLPGQTLRLDLHLKLSSDQLLVPHIQPRSVQLGPECAVFLTEPNLLCLFIS